MEQARSRPRPYRPLAFVPCTSTTLHKTTSCLYCRDHIQHSIQVGTLNLKMAPSKVTKKRSDSTKNQQPIQYWDGKTYACMACKRGHRVKLCDHGKDGKLVSATNQPGRPSSGSDRKCTCPKSCKCTTNCKCARDGCLCVQQMYLIVALKSRPKPVWVNQNEEVTPQWADENGELKTLNPVYTDMNGNVLSPEEARAREEQKEKRRNDPQPSSCCSSKAPKQETSPAPESGCRHRENVPTPAPPSASQCTCGIKCQCTLCPEHPNNNATRIYNSQQLNAMTHNATYMPNQTAINGQLFRPEVPQGSCLGGEASYFLTREQPTAQDFQRLFPGYSPDDFVLTYPMDAPTQTYNHMNNFPQFELDPNFEAMPIPDIPSDPGFDMNFMEQPLDFTFGDADVSTFGPPMQSPISPQTHLHQLDASGSPMNPIPQYDLPPHNQLPQSISSSSHQQPPYIIEDYLAMPLYPESVDHSLVYGEQLVLPSKDLQQALPVTPLTHPPRSCCSSRPQIPLHYLATSP